MFRFRNLRLPGAMLGALVSSTAALSAQSPSSTPAPTTAPTPPAAHVSAERSPALAGTGLLRASKLLGKSVVDSGGVKIGSLEDVAVEDSGFLVAIVKRTDGKLAGLPMEALVVRRDATTDGKEPRADDKLNVKELALSGNADKLSTAPLIDDVAGIDRAWLGSVREHFASAHDNTGRSVPGEPARPEAGEPDAPAVATVCVEKLIGMNVKGTDGAEVGDVEELVMNVSDSRLAYAVISTGGTIGMATTLRGVAWKSLTMDSSGKHFNIAADKAAIEKLPSVDFDHLTARPDLQASATSPAGTGLVAQEPRR